MTHNLKEQAQMTNEKPTNPSHGELLDRYADAVQPAFCRPKDAGDTSELRSLILGKMGEGEKELAAILRFEGEGDEWFIPAEPGPLGPFPFVEAVKEFMAFMDREFSKLDATASRLQSELEEARKLIITKGGKYPEVVDDGKRTFLDLLETLVANFNSRGDRLGLDSTLQQAQFGVPHKIGECGEAAQMGAKQAGASPAERPTKNSDGAEQHRQTVANGLTLPPLSNEHSPIPSASHTPRCPKCGDDLLFAILGKPIVFCNGKCGFEMVTLPEAKVKYFAQFFPVTSSQGGAAVCPKCQSSVTGPYKATNGDLVTRCKLCDWNTTEKEPE